MVEKKITVRGAREHNLKNIDVEIPRDQLVVITGVSGSGKSSLAFHTIFAEGQRRYVESLSAYARQFLGQMEKPDVDQIEGLSPAVSIDQKGVSSNPRSTVGTVTEVYDYLRLLFARAGTPHCPVCARPVMPQSAESIVNNILRDFPNHRLLVLAPLIKDRKGHHQPVFDDVRKEGYVRVRVNGEIRSVDDKIELDRYKNHTIEAVVDRLALRDIDKLSHSDEEYQGIRTRVTDSVETALTLGNGVVIITDVTERGKAVDHLYSEHLFCAYDGTSIPEIEPRTFSFNNPHGACHHCQGLGTKKEINPDLVIPDRSLSVQDGAIVAWPTDDKQGYYWQLLKSTAQHFEIPLNVPVSELNEAQIRVLLYGSQTTEIPVRYTNRDGATRVYKTKYEGVINNLRRRYKETTSDYMRGKIGEYMLDLPCEACSGARLSAIARAVRLKDTAIHQVTSWPVLKSLRWANDLSTDNELSTRQQLIATPIMKEVQERLQFLSDVGLEYLTLSRSAGTLSGGEAQRIRLATQIGSRLMGVLYVLDEPSIGLHQRDNERLIRTLQGMRDLGNTVLVVEHDEDTMRAADHLIDLGPGAGKHGGQIVAAGTPAEVQANKNSLTGRYLSGELSIPTPRMRRDGNGNFLKITGAQVNNLKKIDVSIPLSTMVCFTGVSGSGKSSLVIETLSKKLYQHFYKSKELPGRHDKFEGLEALDKVIRIDQSPIGRTPRSNPATYTNLFNPIRELFASLNESKVRGYKPGRFSFNVKGGRCEACEGQGQNRIEMQFLPDIYVPCEICKGARYNRETLQVTYKGKNIADILELTIEEAFEFLDAHPSIRRRLQTMLDVGLDYIKLGQSAPTLSGGEAQRIKLSRELSKIATGRTIYILDEPSVGLHSHDVARLIGALNRLVDKGNSVIIIEHNLDIIKVADYVVDLGPEGGELGGYIVAEGTPEDIAAVEASHTGRFLKEYLKH
ncbi:MAG: excinuclease ABC subunit UvrA [Candidatus Promineifilaceae bacterium]